MKRSAFSKEELEQWKDYDQTFSDPMDNEVVEGFNGLDKDIAPDDDGWAVAPFGGKVFERVGNGVVTADTCGKLKKTMACFNIDLHSHVTLDGVNHAGKIPLKKIFMSCGKPSCPTCFKRGWANREATNATLILEKLSVGYTDKKGKSHVALGLAEHIISSVPKTDYGLSWGRLTAKNQRVLRSRGVVGGVSIFHLFRYRGYKESLDTKLLMGWYIAPHFHTVGFIEGGYSRCRGCANTFEGENGVRRVKVTAKCLACDGFEGLTRRCYAKEGGGVGVGNSGSGWIVKVMGKRKNLHATIWYQANHATFARGSVRAHVASWWGVCGFTKLQFTKEDKVHHVKCPICLHDMVEAQRVGGDDVEWWVKEWEEPFLDKDGSPNWIPKPESRSKW